MDENNQRLRQLTEEMLSLESPDQLRDAAAGLHALFSRLTGMREDSLDPLDTEPTRLSAGLAIDPLSAARCTLDHTRTSKYLRGVYRAVQAARQRFPAQRIEILYAGCGPFAPLAIPLMTRFAADETRFTLLDIHQRSLDSARRLVETLGFGAHVGGYVQADATAYVHPARRPLHIVIAETMQKALTKEPQVEITLNLVPQLCDGGILIPEKISVDACLFHPATEFQDMPERVRITLGRLMDLDKKSVPLLRGEGFADVCVRIPATGVRPLQMMLRTQVTVFESIVLGDYESGITCPHLVGELDTLEPGGGVVFRYETGSVPGYRARPA